MGGPIPSFLVWFQLCFPHSVQIPPTPKTNVSTAPAPGTPTPISMRTPDSQRKYLDRPSSSCLSHRKTSISHRNGGSLLIYRCTIETMTDAGDMSRSMDSAMSQSVISYYMQEGRSKSQNTPTKIYTPRDVYEGGQTPMGKAHTP